MPTLADHIALVKRHQEWRRGSDDFALAKEFAEAGYPKRLGEALDAVVLSAQRCEKLEAALKAYQSAGFGNSTCFRLQGVAYDLSVEALK